MITTIILYAILIGLVLALIYFGCIAIRNEKRNRKFRTTLNVNDKVRIPTVSVAGATYLTNARITDIDNNFVTVSVTLLKTSIYPPLE